MLKRLAGRFQLPKLLEDRVEGRRMVGSLAPAIDETAWPVTAWVRNLFPSCLRQTEPRTVLAIASGDRGDRAMHPSQVALAPPSLL